MRLDEYTKYDGLGLADLVRRREVSARELAQLTLTGVEKVNPHIHAVLETYTECLQTLDGPAVPEGPFAGVPFFLKDIGATQRGKRQEAGSRLLAGHVASSDSFLTTRFKAAGLTLLGRTATPEFALSSSTESILTGATRNPWNLDLMAGGSSGGAGASVAAGIVPVAHASDGAGSIRIPASACGLVGLKPSRGRITRGPSAAEGLMGMSIEFILSRSVRDTAAMLDAVGQPGVGDPFVIVQPQRPYLQEVGAPVGRLRMAFSTSPWGAFPIDPEIVAAMRQVAAWCEAMGHEVEEATPSLDYEQFLRANCIMWAFGFDVYLDTIAARLGRAVNHDTLEPVTLSLYRFGKTLTAADFFQADATFNQIRRTTGEFFQKYDTFLTPTLIQLPEPIGKYSQNTNDVDFLGFFRRCDETGVFLPLFNVTGQPAISLPLCQSKSGAPIGAHWAARFGHEATLLRLASALEQQVPWSDRRPRVHVDVLP
jgi:amidase